MTPYRYARLGGGLWHVFAPDAPRSLCGRAAASPAWGVVEWADAEPRELRRDGQRAVCKECAERAREGEC